MMIDRNYIKRRDAAIAKIMADVEVAGRAYAAKHKPPPEIRTPTHYLADCGAADMPILGINTIGGLR